MSVTELIEKKLYQGGWDESMETKEKKIPIFKSFLICSSIVLIVELMYSHRVYIQGKNRSRIRQQTISFLQKNGRLVEVIHYR